MTFLVQQLFALVVLELLWRHQVVFGMGLLLDLVERLTHLHLLVILATKHLQEIATLIGLVVVQEVYSDHSVTQHW